MTHPTDDGPALKPCKCGGEAELEQSGVFDRIVCHSCGTATDWVNDYTDAVIESWNAKRTPKDEATADIAAGRKLDDAINKSEVEFMRGLKPSDEARRLVERRVAELIDRMNKSWEKGEYPYGTISTLLAFVSSVATAAPQNAGEAKPVAWRWHRHFKGLWHYDEEKPEFSGPTIVPEPLYTALPHADLVAAVKLERLKSAVEGECDGLAITDEQASEILAYVETGLAPDERTALTNGGKNARTDAGEAGE